MTIDRKHPHAAYHEDLDARLAHERRVDTALTVGCMALLVACVAVFLVLVFAGGK